MTPIDADLSTRRDDVARHPVLQRTAARLERLSARLVEGPVYLPTAKALLSRDGGVCPHDGARLAFHPYEPDRHRCERCGGVFEGERHHRAWVMRYHIWLSERVVHLALLGALLDRPDLSRRAAEILEELAGRYRDYPNADNVLGPTRPFFSTYLESIWLTQLSVAALLLDTGASDALSPAARRTLGGTVTESAGLIASFDEGWSNRQVWHATALAAAGAWLEHEPLVIAATRRLTRLLDAVGEDGLWHEGESYHLFALRGFLLGAEVLRWRGHDLYAGTRLGRMYGAPLDTLLPDLTLPARGDAAFGVSVCQPRFAELWELGRARAADPRLDAILRRLYAADLPEAEDGGLVELAEQEWNRPPHRQHRDRLGWKALCWMPAHEPESGSAWERSALLEDRGVAVVRDGNRAVMLECGRRRGGHAHPDRLHLSVYWGQPVLADFGTGSYVNPSLHWYRAALSHNAPSRANVGQTSGAAACDAFTGDGPWRWCRARAHEILGPGTTVARSVFLGPDLLLDVLDVDAPADAVVDLPIHPLSGVGLPGTSPGPGAAPSAPSDAGHETGYDRIQILSQVGPTSLPLGDSGLALSLVPRPGETILVARAPGPPGPDFADGPPLSFFIRRAAGRGRWVQCLAPAGSECTIREDGPDVLVTREGREWRIIEGADGATIETPGRPPVRLSARAAVIPRSPSGPSGEEPPVVRIPLAREQPRLDAWPAGAACFELGESHYRRSELSWEESGPFRARLELVAWHDALCFRFAVVKREPVFRSADAPDPALDNESPDIHSDGVQCYVGRDRWAGYLVVPEPGTGGIRSRPVAGTGARPGDVGGEFRRTRDGYELLVRCRTGVDLRSHDRLRFAAAVNQMLAGRQRRVGQLALGGGGWVYLRGDREPPDAALVAEVG
jgi:hypothetical protein